MPNYPTTVLIDQTDIVCSNSAVSFLVPYTSFPSSPVPGFTLDSTNGGLDSTAHPGAEQFGLNTGS